MTEAVHNLGQITHCPSGKICLCLLCNVLQIIRFFSLACGDRHYSQYCVRSIHMTSNSLESFFSQSWVISSHTCSYQHSAEHSRGTLCRSSKHSLGSSLLAVFCSWNPSCATVPSLSAPISSAGVHLGSSSFIATWKLSQVITWCDCRPHPISFHLSGISVLHCRMVNVLKSTVSDISLF